MRKNSKKWLALILVLGFIFLANESMASSYTDGIYDIVNSKTLSHGVEHENIKRLTTSGWWNINVIRVDMTNQDNEIKNLISNKGVSHRDTVTNLTNQNKALAGINGNFFDYSPLPSPIGGVIDRGKVISSTVEKVYTWPSFMVDNNNRARTVLLDRKMTAKSRRSKMPVTINMINKIKSPKSTPNAVMMFDYNWRDSTPGNTITKDVVEIVVDNNKVTHIRTNQGPVKLNKNRYVLHLTGTTKSYVKYFKQGDIVDINISSNPDLSNIKFLVGGSSQILKNGVPTATHHNLKGNHPRTGIGVSKDGKELILATIDGRHSKYKGVSQEDFGAILKSLGMYDAVNLDGGGSTTMAAKTINEKSAKLMNIPSDGSQRSVTDGVGVVANPTRGRVNHIEIRTADKNIFNNTSREFVVKGKDGFLNDIDIDRSKVKLSIQGFKGDTKGLTVYPKSKGYGKVIAEYEGMTDSIDVRILDNPQAIEVPYKEFKIKPGEKRYIKPIYASDGNGFKALVYPRDINFELTNNVGEFKDGWFYPNENGGAGLINLRLGNALNSILVSTGDYQEKLDVLSDFDGLNFKSYPSYVGGGLTKSDSSLKSGSSIELSYDFTKGNELRAAYVNFKKPVKLEANASSIGLWLKGDGMHSSLKGTIVDENNKKHSISFAEIIDSEDWKYVEARIPANIKSKELRDIYVLETSRLANHKGSILLENMSVNYRGSLDHIKPPKPTVQRDDKNYLDQVRPGGFSFIVTKAQPNLSQNSLSHIKNRANKHKLSIFVNPEDKGFNKGLKNDLIINTPSPFYMGKDYKNTLFFNINSSAGGIRLQSAKQWTYIKNTLNKTRADHIVMVLPTRVFGSGGFKDSLEARVLHEMLLDEFNKGRTVWVIQKSNKTSIESKDGIRYIDFDARDLNSKNLKNLKAIEFVVNGKDISYQINSVF